MPNCYLYAHHLFGTLTHQRALLLKASAGDWDERLLYYEPRYAATIPWSKRPQGVRVRRALESGDTLVIISPHAISQNAKKVAAFVRLLKTTGVIVLFASDTKPAGKGDKPEKDRFARGMLENQIVMLAMSGKTPREIAHILAHKWSATTQWKGRHYLVLTADSEEAATRFARETWCLRSRVKQGVPWYNGKPYTASMIRNIIKRHQDEMPTPV